MEEDRLVILKEEALEECIKYRCLYLTTLGLICGC